MAIVGQKDITLADQLDIVTRNLWNEELFVFELLNCVTNDRVSCVAECLVDAVLRREDIIRGARSLGREQLMVERGLTC
jgi:hypothetical protein